MKVVYGLNAAYEADPTMEAIEEGLGSGREVLVQGASLVETLPFLRHLPSFLPFQKRLARARDAKGQGAKPSTKEWTDVSLELPPRLRVCRGACLLTSCRSVVAEGQVYRAVYASRSYKVART